MPDEPNVLDYSTPAPPPPPHLLRGAAGGVVVGATFTFFIGACTGLALFEPYPRQPWSPHRFWVHAIGFGVFAAASIVASVLVIRNSKRPRPFIAGLLIGIAVISLIEGVCFYTS